MKRNQGFTLTFRFSVNFNIRADHPSSPKKQAETAKQLSEQLGTAGQPKERRNSIKTSMVFRCLFVLVCIGLAISQQILDQIINNWDFFEPIIQVIQLLFFVSRWLI